MVRKHLFRPVIVLFHVTDITEKILSDRNTCIVPLLYCLHGYIVHIVIITIIDIATVTISSRNRNNMDID